jgi:hypothetical protein
LIATEVSSPPEYARTIFSAIEGARVVSSRLLSILAAGVTERGVSVPKLATIPLSRLVREILEEDLSIQDSLHRGYANVSAVARSVKPMVEQRGQRRVNLASLITTVKRARLDYRGPPPSIRAVVAGSIVNVRTDVAKVSVEKSTRALDTVRKLLAEYQEEFLQVSESLHAITLIFDQRLGETVRSACRREKSFEEELNLAAIIVQSPPAIVKTPGCILAFLSQLSRRRINIEDVVSCYTDTIVIVQMAEVGKAFGALTDMIAAARARAKAGAAS